MRQSKLFPKTQKQSPKEAESINHQLLVRGGFIDQLMAGSWTLLPMGLRVVDKINEIIRQEMNAIGAQEILMPLLHPKNIWNETGRWKSADEVMYKLLDVRGKDYVLSFTHEEIFLDLVRKSLTSYQDLPIALYHFSTKFRNEARARAGILRGREFMMKDLYSVHADEKDFWNFYEAVKSAYSNVFKRIGFDFIITQAGGGVFTDNFTHEFQVPAEGGEDVIFRCTKCSWAVNHEVFDKKVVGDKVLDEKSKTICPMCGAKVEKAKSIEVGNIFPFGTYYSEKMNVYYTSKDGKKKPVWFGSYGIGSTRVMGTWVEVSHDQKGIIWNKAITPFDVHLIEMVSGKKQVMNRVEEVYSELQKAGIEVLWDDRQVSAGEKFADADLIGIPVRLVISEKTGDKIEWKERSKKETEIFTLDEVIKRLSV